MGKYKVALIGTGNMGKNHLRVIEKSPDFTLKTIVDPAFDRQRFPEVNVPVLENLSDVPWDSIDCAVVASPTETHFPVVQELLKNKIHTLVEKPAASTLEQAQKLVGLAKQVGVYLAVGNIERCNPVISRMEQVLRSGLIGTPIHLSALRGGAFPNAVKEGNNVVLDLAVHDMDVFSLLLGPLEILSAIGHKNKLPDIFDATDIQVRSAEGITGSIHANWLSPHKLRQIKVFGSRGVCEVDYVAQTCHVYGNDLDQSALSQLEPFQSREHPFTQHVDFEVVKGEPLMIQLGEWFECLEGKASRLAQNAELLESVSLAEKAINLANENFKPISLPTGLWRQLSKIEDNHNHS